MSVRRLIILTAAIASIVLVFMLVPRRMGNDNGRIQIAIFSIVEIEPIAELRKGFRAEFEQSEFAHSHKVEFVEFNAQGDSALVNQISDQIVSSKPRLAFVLGTPAAQALQKRSPDLLIVQGAGTDPVSAGLAADWSGSGRNYIATSDLPPLGKQLELIHILTPKVVRVGVIYNPGETNSVAVVSRLRALTHGRGVSLVERSVSTSGDIPLALASLLHRVDAIYLPPDNTVYSAIPEIGQFAKENQIPLYATTQGAMDAGALAALSLDFVELGKESADLALEVLNGKDPRTIPITVNRNPSIQISARVARQLAVDTSAASKLAKVKVFN